MTKRELFVAMTEGTVVTAEMAEFAAKEIEKIDKADIKRREKAAEKNKEREALKEEILGVLGDEPKTATMVGEEFEISTQKASALLRALVADGKATQVEVKISGKGKQKGYTK